MVLRAALMRERKSEQSKDTGDSHEYLCEATRVSDYVVLKRTRFITTDEWPQEFVPVCVLHKRLAHLVEVFELFLSVNMNRVWLESNQ